MPLSWNEIKHRAIAFSKDWKDETREDAEAKSFWDAFFQLYIEDHTPPTAPTSARSSTNFSMC